jgi:quinol-cytochrome oxidoreductase complex cytochrome b subunit
MFSQPRCRTLPKNRRDDAWNEGTNGYRFTFSERRFFSLHYLLPFLIVGAPHATVKDAFGTACFLILYAWFVFYIPNFLGHADNYIPADPAVTPTHIVPEWYYLPRSFAPSPTS